MLSQKLFGQKILPYHQPPSQPTGELFGLDYLRGQSDFLLGEEASVEENVEVDEGLGDESMIYQSALSISEDLSTFTTPVDSDEEEEEEQDEVWENVHVVHAFSNLYIIGGSKN